MSVGVSTLAEHSQILKTVEDTVKNTISTEDS